MKTHQSTPALRVSLALGALLVASLLPPMVDAAPQAASACDIERSVIGPSWTCASGPTRPCLVAKVVYKACRLVYKDPHRDPMICLRPAPACDNCTSLAGQFSSCCDRYTRGPVRWTCRRLEALL